MSGGSWDYLYSKDIDELINEEKDIQKMANFLASLDYAPDVARETQELLLIIRQFKNHAETIKNRIEKVWKAVEWWHSCDSGEEELKEAIKDYRGEA